MLTITAPIFSPHGKNSTSMHPSPSHNTVPVVLETEGIAFGLLFLHNVVDAIPNSPVLFLDQSDETSFHYPSQCCKESHHLQQHTVPANVRKYFFGWGLCCHQQARNPAVSKTFHHLLDHMIPLVQSLLPCIYSLWWAYRYFLSLSRGSLWATTMGLTGDVSVPVLKMFHPLSDAASTHTDVSLCTLKSCVIIWCGHLFLTKFYHYTLL